MVAVALYQPELDAALEGLNCKLQASAAQRDKPLPCLGPEQVQAVCAHKHDMHMAQRLRGHDGCRVVPTRA